MKNRLGARVWAVLLLVGLTGQFAWTIENMYLNVFLYKTISQDPGYIAAMVGWSAAAATLTTLLMGALSDRVGRRKPFIVFGYLAWGVSVAAFGFISVDGMSALFAHAAAAAAVAVVILDCVMPFFGSTANDAAFNAYVTDVTNDGNRGRAESVLATLPLLSMLIIFGVFDGYTQRGEWRTFYLIFGVMVSLVGLAALLLIDEKPRPGSDAPYFKNLLYGFRPSVVRKNGALYLSFAAFCIFSVAVQVFFPYLIIYIQNYLGIDNYAIVLGVVLLTASAVSVSFGKVIDRVGKLTFVLPALAAMLTGLLGMFFVRSMLGVMVAGSVMMGGYMLVSAALGADIRDRTPKDKVGLFLGIRMIFAVLLPMLIGPQLGAAVIRNSGSTYVELGQIKSVPTPDIFLAAAAVLVAALVPVLYLRRYDAVYARLSDAQREQLEEAVQNGSSVGIIGGADGPTVLHITNKEDAHDE